MKSLNVVKKKWNFTISLVVFLFIIMIALLMLSILITILLHQVGRLSFEESNPVNPYGTLSAMIIICTIFGIGLTVFFKKKALSPMRKAIDAIHKVADGNFDVQLDLKGVEELEELSQSFNKMTRELSSIETLRSDFINNFSHEFKTPIVSVRGFAKLLKEGNLTEEEQQEYLDIIITESERLADISTSVLNMSKYENIEIVTEKVLFRLDEQIRRAIVMTEPKWSAKEITVNVELDEVTFKGNEDLTQEIWLNLLDNAIKFSCEGGQISVSLISENNGIRFTIQDEGIGMAEHTKAHIFDKFYQTENSCIKAGSGLGLTIVKRITELCHGTIEVQSDLGKGSTFTVLLPSEYS